MKNEKWIGGPTTKPNWDDFYMSLSYAVSQRSVDESTVHGACMVSKDHRLLSIGYNGPIRGSSPDPKDLKERPSKYWLMIHAEENCIMNYHGSNSDLEGATMYITGEPCHKCMRMILQKGIRRIIYGNVGSKCVDRDDILAKEKMIESLSHEGTHIGSIECAKKHIDPTILQYLKYEDMSSVKSVLQKTLNYIDYKENSNG